MQEIGIGKNILDPSILSAYIEPAMFLAFLGALLFFGIISVVLNYHWTQYGINKERLSKIRGIYFGVSAVFILTMAGFIFGAIQ